MQRLLLVLNLLLSEYHVDELVEDDYHCKIFADGTIAHLLDCPFKHCSTTIILFISYYFKSTIKI